MGLGKTIQAIALIHTALKQSVAGRPLAQKAIVVCPSLLVANWQREFKQWVGSGKQAIIDKKGKEAEKQVGLQRVWRPGLSPSLVSLTFPPAFTPVRPCRWRTSSSAAPRSSQ